MLTHCNTSCLPWAEYECNLCKIVPPLLFFRIHKEKPGAKCLPGFRFIRQIAVLTANLLHRLQNTLI
ncbi:hypothetical protein FA041_10625 [Escherichia coli]|nr:hypothetical protein [Escherichia coli]MBW9312766.1 hypothetical protein [Escherichia coli]